MTTYREFQKALKIVNDYKNQIDKHHKEVEKQYKEINRFAGITRETIIMDIRHIEVRTLNCLVSAGYLNWETKVKDFENIRISELLIIRNFGNKSLKDIKEICFYAGVKLLP